MEQTFSKKLIIVQLVNKFPALYGTQIFIAVSQDQASGPYSESVEASPQ
jgi:hypothetical protein